MDIRSGKTYETLDAALADGVPRSDIAHVTTDERLNRGLPIVKFSKGSFKSFKREDGELVRVK